MCPLPCHSISKASDFSLDISGNSPYLTVDSEVKTIACRIIIPLLEPDCGISWWVQESRAKRFPTDIYQASHRRYLAVRCPRWALSAPQSSRWASSPLCPALLTHLPPFFSCSSWTPFSTHCQRTISASFTVSVTNFMFLTLKCSYTT